MTTHKATRLTDKTIGLFGQVVEMTVPEQELAIKDWFIRTESGHPIDGRIIGIIAETEKAMRVVIPGIDAHDEDDRTVLWVPKSCIEVTEPTIDKVITVEVGGNEFEIVRKENGALAAYCHGEEQCKITEGYDYRMQIEAYIEGAY